VLFLNQLLNTKKEVDMKSQRAYKIGEIVFCPLNDRAHKVIGFDKMGLPITKEISPSAVYKAEGKKSNKKKRATQQKNLK
jgi:hypothetical protein